MKFLKKIFYKTVQHTCRVKSRETTLSHSVQCGRYVDTVAEHNKCDRTQDNFTERVWKQNTWFYFLTLLIPFFFFFFKPRTEFLSVRCWRPLVVRPTSRIQGRGESPTPELARDNPQCYLFVSTGITRMRIAFENVSRSSEAPRRRIFRPKLFTRNALVRYF